MPVQENSVTSSSRDTLAPTPWWIHLCRWLWKLIAFLGTAIVLSLGINVLSIWLTSSRGVIPADSPFAVIVVHWPITLLVGCCFLLFATLIWMLSRWPIRSAALSTPVQQNRARMLQRLSRTYDDILSQSLQGIAWMELGLAHQPDAVQNAATLILRLPHRTEQLLPPGTSIIQVYEEAAHELLILGEPGAGKSTLLLQLAQQLLVRCEQDDAQPLPVLLPLSSWAVTRPKFEDWLAEQVAQVYDIPEPLARLWVQEEQLLPLLDGLDEIEETARPACIVAINAYRHMHPGPLVACSRWTEYKDVATHHRLSLQGAVVVQPLSHEQVDTYLAQAGKPLEALRRSLKKNPTLQELTSTPLMLSVLMLTYQGTSLRLVSRKEAELLQQVWTDYVLRMVERKGNAGRYSLEDTRTWLHWLANEMQEHNQTVFYLEHLQPDWLPKGQQLAYTWLAIRIPGILIGVLAGLIITLFLYGITFSLYGYDSPAPLLQSVVLSGFLGGIFSEVNRGETVLQTLKSHSRLTNRRVIIERVAICVLIGLAYGISVGLQLISTNGTGGFWLWYAIISGVGIGLSCWLLLSLLPHFNSRKMQATATDMTHSWWALRHLMYKWHGQRALLVAAALGGGNGLSFGLAQWLFFGPVSGLIFWFAFLLVYGLLFGLISVLISMILEVQTGDVHLTERLRWTWRSLVRSLLTSRHLDNTVFLVGIVLVLVGLGLGLTDLLDEGLQFGLRTLLSFGLSTGLSLGLSYWLLIGLFQGISHEQVEDQDRRVFNQGIQRSLRNSRIMGIISGGVIGIIGLLNVGLNHGLNHGLNYGLQDGLNYGLQAGLHYGWLLAVSGGMLVYAVSGGLAVLRHTVLRLLLWRTHTFPWQAVPFLEDARARILLRRVGGGYSFMHRLLLEYFAGISVEMPSVSALQRSRSSHP